MSNPSKPKNWVDTKFIKIPDLAWFIDPAVSFGQRLAQLCYLSLFSRSKQCFKTEQPHQKPDIPNMKHIGVKTKNWVDTKFIKNPDLAWLIDPTVTFGQRLVQLRSL